MATGHGVADDTHGTPVTVAMGSATATAAGVTRVPGGEAAPATAPLVLAERLGRSFRKVSAVAQVSLEARGGEIFGIVGADGSGKTTLLQMLAAILDPTSGRCEVLGFDTLRQSAEVTSRIGYMSQGFTLYERLSVEENLAFAAACRNVRAEAFRERRERLLGMAGLERFAQRRAGALSGGMKKKLALCSNLIHEPRVLLLDEPSLGVDPLSRRELWRLLADYRARGAAVLLATSYMDEAERCDRVLFLHEGRVLAAGSPDDLKARIRGTVFEVETDEPAAVEARLTADARVRSVVRLPRKIRFELDPEQSGSRASLPEGLEEARAAAPQLEDLFAAAAPAGGSKSFAPHIRASGAPRPNVTAATTVLARGVTCRFGQFIAVNDASLELRAGEVFGFLGPNGAGKTTLIRILCGLQRFESGSAETAGIDVRRNPRALRARIGYMSQRFSLYPDLTVMENLEFFGGLYPLSPTDRASAVAWAVEVAGLGDMTDRRVGEISGAVRQRLALACSVMHRPQVLFLDEPTSGVDPLSRHRFWRLVYDLAATGITAFVTTHYLEEAAYCDRLGLMLTGRLIALGAFDDLRAREGLPATAGVEELFLHYIERSARAGTAGRSVS